MCCSVIMWRFESVSHMVPLRNTFLRLYIIRICVQVCTLYILSHICLYIVYIVCIQPVEAAEVQAYNDFIIFSVAGAGSLISGVLFAAYGKYDVPLVQ